MQVIHCLPLSAPTKRLGPGSRQLPRYLSAKRSPDHPMALAPGSVVIVHGHVLLHFQLPCRGGPGLHRPPAQPNLEVKKGSTASRFLLQSQSSRCDAADYPFTAARSGSSPTMDAAVDKLPLDVDKEKIKRKLDVSNIGPNAVLRGIQLTFVGGKLSRVSTYVTLSDLTLLTTDAQLIEPCRTRPSSRPSTTNKPPPPSWPVLLYA